MWPNAHARADLQAFLIFCFKPILILAHKLSLLIYGDNKYPDIFFWKYNSPYHIEMGSYVLIDLLWAGGSEEFLPKHVPHV